MKRYIITMLAALLSFAGAAKISEFRNVTPALGDKIRLHRPGQQEAERLSLDPGTLTYATDGTPLRIVSCALRNSGCGWTVIDDKAHEPVGIQSVDETASAIKITFDEDFKEVVSLLITPDESFGGLFSFGASIATDGATILIKRTRSIGGYFYYNGSDWSSLAADMVSSMNWVDDALRVTFEPGVMGASASVAAVCSARGGNYIAQIRSSDSDTIDIEFYDFSGELITTPTTDMKVSLTVPGSNDRIDPAAVHRDLVPGSNILIYGVMVPAQ